MQTTERARREHSIFMARIKYFADIEAEFKHGINSYAELMHRTGRFYTFRFITIPSITVGYGTYDAARDAWVR